MRADYHNKNKHFDKIPKEICIAQITIPDRQWMIAVPSCHSYSEECLIT